MSVEVYPCITRCPCLMSGRSGVQLPIFETIQIGSEPAVPDGYWFEKYHISYTYNAVFRPFYPNE